MLTPLRLIFGLSAFAALSFIAQAQITGGAVRMSGQVSGMVAISEAPTIDLSGGKTHLATRQLNPQTILFSLTGNRRGESEVRLRLRVRSNTAYALMASAQSTGAVLSRLSIVSIRATGRFVAAGAEKEVKLADGVGVKDEQYPQEHPVESLPSPLSSISTKIFRGSHISTAGTLNSPDNALEVILVLHVETPSDEDWELQLLLYAIVLQKIF